MNQDIFPKISIVTPSFNQSSFIEATIQSVITQNYPNLEYVIIDGGSTDGSIEIIKKYEKHLHYWCSEPDNGQYDAINKGFSHSTGEIMAWLNSDDMYLPWSLRTVASIMSTFPNIEWLSTLSPVYWDYEGFCSGFSNTLGFSREAFLDGCYLPRSSNSKSIAWIQQESTFWRRSLWQKTGGFLSTDTRLAGDFELWCRFYTKADLYGTHSPLGGFRSQYYQKCRNIEEYYKEAELGLSAMRSSLHWKPNLFRNRLSIKYRKIILKLPKFMISLWGYDGKKVIKERLEQPNGCWKIENYKF